MYDIPFTYAIHIARTTKLESIIEFAYTETPDGTPLEQIKNELQMAQGTVNGFGNICVLNYSFTVNIYFLRNQPAL